jgi:uncharacterized membrane protein YqjE
MSIPEPALAPMSADDPRDLSTLDLVTRTIETVTRLVTTEIELARAEVKADLAAAVGVAIVFGIVAVMALLGLNMLLVAAVFALALVMPGWLAALIIGVVLLVAAAIAALIGKRRLKTPLAVTRKNLKESLEWAKQRLA